MVMALYIEESDRSKLLGSKFEAKFILFELWSTFQFKTTNALLKDDKSIGESCNHEEVVIPQESILASVLGKT